MQHCVDNTDININNGTEATAGQIRSTECAWQSRRVRQASQPMQQLFWQAYSKHCSHPDRACAVCHWHAAGTNQPNVIAVHFGNDLVLAILEHGIIIGIEHPEHKRYRSR